MGKNKLVVEISAKTIIFAVFFVLALQFIVLIKDILFSVFIAFILRSAFMPIVAKLRRFGFPQTIAAILVFFSFLILIGFFLGLIIPPLVIETSNLFRNLPEYFSLFGVNSRIESLIDSSLNFLPNFTTSFFSVVGAVFSNAFFVIMTLFLTLYFLIQDNLIKDLLVSFVEEEKIIFIVEVVEKVEKRLSAWMWGELVLMFLIGFFTYIGLKIIGVKYTLSLAVLAGLLEVVPNVGPILSLIPAVLVALSNSYLQGLSVVGLYFLIQQVENTLIVPLIMNKAVGLNPIVTLLALVVGGRLAGVLGVILSIPVLLVAETILIEILKYKRSSNS